MIIIYSSLTLILIVLLYITIKNINKPVRKLKSAQKRKTFYMLDDPADVRKNFLLTYKGVLFEGEKYPNEFLEVTSIFIWIHGNSKQEILRPNDLIEIEKRIQRHYPKTSIDWKNAEPSS